MSALVLQKLLPRWPALGQYAASPPAWALLATVLLMAAILNGSGPTLAEWLGDTDDAVRLVSVRELLAGAPWFDTTLPRIGAPEPLVSHWSRLIDAPLAALIGALTPLLGAESAELATRVIWPGVLLFALLLIVAREAERLAGPGVGAWAAAFAIVLAVTSVMAFVQFRPGRVDHHNAQILCAVAGLLLLVRSWEEPRAGWMAGAQLGLGLAIGYEAIALVAAALGLAAAAALLWPRHGSGIANAAAAATAALLAALVLTVPPTRWLAIHCDALSLNLPVLAAGCTAGLWAALRFGRSVPARFAIAGLGAAAGALAYAALEPACLAGPFGQVSPAVKATWLVTVSESKSIFWLASLHPAPALGAMAFMLAGAAAQLALWHERRDAGTGLAAVVVVLAAVLGCWQLKLLPYACWLAVPPIAVLAAGLAGTVSISAPLLRIAAVVLMSQATFDAAFGVLLSPFRSVSATAGSVEATDLRQPCYRSANVRRLAALPPGLVAGEINLGPYVVALTPHRVVAAPYHRLQTSIPAIYAILGGAPADALPRLRALGVDYVALCAEPAAAGAAAPQSLRARLLDGQRVDGLEELALGGSAAIRVWKVAR